MNVVKEIQDSLSQGTGWLVMAATFVADSLPEVSAVAGSSMETVAASFEQIREIVTQTATYLAAAWIGLPSRLRAKFQGE